MMNIEKIRSYKGIIIAAISVIGMAILFYISEHIEISDKIFSTIFFICFILLFVGMILHAKRMFGGKKPTEKNKQPWD
jgi:uncharacterized membrane protein YfcA